MEKLLIILLSFVLTGIANASVITGMDASGTLKTSDDFQLIFEKDTKEIVLQDYSSADSIEAILYDDFVIYNGDQGGIGLYLYDIQTDQSYLLNDRGDFKSAIFYNNFNEKNEKLYIEAGMEISSMPKICIYDLKKLDNFVQEKSDKIKDYLKESKNSQFPNLYDITNQEKIVYCTFDDGKYYYDFKWLEDGKISYIVCEDGICEDKKFNNGKLYESDWNGENKQLIKVISNSRKTAILYGLGILAVGGIGYGAIRRKKRQK